MSDKANLILMIIYLNFYKHKSYRSREFIYKWFEFSLMFLNCRFLYFASFYMNYVLGTTSHQLERTTDLMKGI